MIDYDSPIKDADIEMADLQAQANTISQLAKSGICFHGHYKAPIGEPCICFRCGKIFETEVQLIAEYEELKIQYL